MRTKAAVILITLLLIVSVNAQKNQEISDLKTQTITLSRKARKDKTAPPRSWILVETGGRQIKPVQFKGPPSTIDDLPSTDVIEASASARNVGQVQVTSTGKRSYSIRYGGLSMAADDLWLQVMATPPGGMGLLTDMGQMKWEEVHRMPVLVLKPITSRISITMNKGVSAVGPEGSIVRAVAGHVYAAQIKDDRTVYRVIFRIDSIDSNGDCNISWKRIPSKWAAWVPPTQPNESLDASRGSAFLKIY
ncbi:MAG TPA: hypothetical protein DC054_09105 [Blastocatellia bacterium]|nr:hypothetical protein [Blastocatellia bacterium]